MSERKSRLTLSLGQLLLIFLGALTVFLALDCWRQASVSRQWQAERQAVEQKVERAEARKALLEDRLEYAQSDAAAEEWAREQGWVKENEVPVVLVAPEAFEQGAAQPAPGEAPPTAPEQQTWWERLFGRR